MTRTVTTWRELKAAYGGGDRRATVNAMLRAEVPGGAELLTAADKLHVALTRRDGRVPAGATRAATQAAADGLRRVLDDLRAGLLAAKGLARGGDEAGNGETGSVEAGNGETPPVGRGVRGAAVGGRSALIHAPGGARRPGRVPVRTDPVVSIHAGLPATAGVSTARPRPSSKMPTPPPDDNRGWTPPAAAVERMGKESDEAIGAAHGVSAHAVAAARGRLSIPAFGASAGGTFRGAKLKAAREAKKWTGAELAARAKIGGGRAYVSQLEGGKRQPTLATLSDLAAALGVTPASLLG